MNLETAVFISKQKADGQEEFLGKFIFKNEYREGMETMYQNLEQYSIHILSGDNASEEEKLKKMIPHFEQMAFLQPPENKLDYIHHLQEQGKKIAMFGDGLNDAGALKQSNVGVAISDDSNSFTPSSDVIMDGQVLKFLPDFLKLSKEAMRIIKITFVISFLYNIIGLSFAVTGHLSPLIAAILMPISSISVVLFTTLSTWICSKKYFKK